MWPPATVGQHILQGGQQVRNLPAAVSAAAAGGRGRVRGQLSSGGGCRCDAPSAEPGLAPADGGQKTRQEHLPGSLVARVNSIAGRAGGGHGGRERRPTDSEELVAAGEEVGVVGQPGGVSRLPASRPQPGQSPQHSLGWASPFSRSPGQTRASQGYPVPDGLETTADRTSCNRSWRKVLQNYNQNPDSADCTRPAEKMHFSFALSFVRCFPPSLLENQLKRNTREENNTACSTFKTKHFYLLCTKA